MKNARHTKILEIIEEYEICTQEALLQKLSESGFEVTQTTISRDIRELKLVKGPTGRGSYKYVVSGSRAESAGPTHNSTLTDSIVKVDSAMNIVVLKTLPGMANAIAVCIEPLVSKDVVGSVAGDDTILMVTRTVEKAEDTVREIKALISK